MLISRVRLLVLLGLASITTTTLVTFHSQNITYQRHINQITKQLEDQETKQHQQMQLQLQQLQKDNSAKQQQIDDLNHQLQAKREQNAAMASIQLAQAPLAPKSVVAFVSDAKGFIYSHESGNNPGAVNASSGACGLGQALPCSKMPCSLSDYTCQDNFFTGYMLSRYGTWESARAWWLGHSWW